MNTNSTQFIRLKKSIEKNFTIFIALLFLEGIFRKWLLPESLGNIFLVIREPFVLLIVLKGMKYNLITSSRVKCLCFISILTFVLTLIFGHHNLFVAIYGVRICLLYFPAIYIVGNVIDYKYILRIGKYLIYAFIPIVCLTVAQFSTSPSSFFNAGAYRGNESFGTAGELMLRPSGVFTYIVGLTDYYMIALAFIVYFKFEKLIKGQLLNLCFIFYIISIPVSVSRTHFYFTLVFLLCMIPLAGQRYIARLVMSLIFVSVVIVGLQSTSTFSRFTDVFTERLTGANETEGGISNSAMDRTFGYAIGVLSQDIPVFGFGEGYCTNVGVKAIYGTVGVNNISDLKLVKRLEDSEMEWSRIIMEDGPFLGLLIVFLRILIGFDFIRLARRSMRRNNILPWMFMPCAFILVTTGALKQSANLGFMLVASAFLVASSRFDFVNKK